jgi:hypothetical protein
VNFNLFRSKVNDRQFYAERLFYRNGKLSIKLLKTSPLARCVRGRGEGKVVCPSMCKIRRSFSFLNLEPANLLKL